MVGVVCPSSVIVWPRSSPPRRILAAKARRKLCELAAIPARFARLAMTRRIPFPESPPPRGRVLSTLTDGSIAAITASGSGAVSESTPGRSRLVGSPHSDRTLSRKVDPVPGGAGALALSRYTLVELAGFETPTF